MSLNNAGTDQENPILEGIAFQIRLNKQNAAETLRKCYVTVGDIVFSNLTAMAVESDTLIYLNVTAGEHLMSDSTPVKNVVHFTTSEHRHSKIVLWVADKPDVKVTLDGYNAESPLEPLIWPIYL